MYCLSVLYENQLDGTFDLDYYVRTHMQLVQDRLGPGGLIRYELAKGIAGWPPDMQTPNTMICNMYFNALDDLQRAFGAHCDELIEDISVYTNIKPRMQISEILG